MAFEYDYTVILTAFIGIIAAVVTNIFIFEHQFYKEKQRDFIKKQIDELLLPLFIRMKEFEMEMDYQIEGECEWDWIISKDTKIKKIAEKKLNLANPKLSKLLLNFINYQYLNDEVMQNVRSNIVNENFLDLKQEVYNEYEQKVKEYQDMKPRWQIWKK